MWKRGWRSVRALGLSLLISTACVTAAAANEPETAEAPEPSAVVSDLAGWVVATSDNHGRPFLVIDKRTAQVVIFDAQGQPLASTPALLGLAQGDDSVEGIGDRELAKIAPDERTTPAGRFRARFGPAAGHGETFWIDFATAISMHPVVTTKPKERRLERLNSPSAEDNRITYGCINVSAVFYEQVVRPTFEGEGGIAYVLPDTKPLEEVFPSLSLKMASAGRATD